MAHLATMALRNRRRLVRWALMGGVLGLAIGVAAPARWTAAAVFMPQEDNNGIGALAGLAAQFGVTVPGGTAGASPEFYAALVQSRQLIGAVAESRYDFETAEGLPFLKKQVHHSGTLIDLLGVKSADSASARDLAIDLIATKHLTVTTDDPSGLITVKFTSPWAPLSAQVAARMIALVDRFNSEERQTQAAAERAFVQDRLTHADADLQAAEGRLQQFLAQNRSFGPASPLAFEQDRLQRDVAMQQQVYTGLQQSYEQARIEEVRNTPRITVVDPPDQPARPDRRRLGLKAVLGAFIAAFAGLGLILAQEILARSSGGGDSGALRAELAALGADARRALGRLLGRKQRAA